MSLPKFEAQLTVPSGGYSVSVTDSGGTSSVTVLAAGTYFLNSSTNLLSAIGSALTADATLAGTYTLSCDDNNTTSTGKVTIACSGGGNPSITWGSATVLRSALGFTADLSGASSYQGSNSSQLIWMPNVKRATPMAPDGGQGVAQTDVTVTISPSGKSKVLKYATRYIDLLAFRYLLGNKVWQQYEAVTNESWESFYTNCVANGYPIRYYPDRSVDGTYATYRVTQCSSLGVEPEFAGMVGDGSAGANLLWKLGPLELIKYV